MNDALEADDGEETRGHGGCCNQDQDDQSQETSGVATSLSLEEGASHAGSHVCCLEWVWYWVEAVALAGTTQADT